MIVIVGNAITKYIPHFTEYYSDCVERNIEHEHSRESTNRTDVVRFEMLYMYFFYSYCTS